MDIQVPFKEVSEEVVRESLIAISYSTPDKALNTLYAETEALSSSSNKDGGAVDMSNSGVVEMYMSELISISNYQAPECPASSPRMWT
ncbi:unnamed protein product [Linum tenue]|uniref:Uncharacterized protein n=1 Tax=Linum tenue TaxID=586396 RepID=A0AAV0PJP1_9ROSI|nr:unnamed protein product [Linum tenue]